MIRFFMLQSWMLSVETLPKPSNSTLALAPFYPIALPSRSSPSPPLFFDLPPHPQTLESSSIMPLFLPDDELRQYSPDAAIVAERADTFIRNLYRQLDTIRAEADAASIAAEQTAALLEQRYAALSDDLSRLQSENAQLSAAAEQRLAQLADAQAEKHQIHLKAMGKDGEIERLSVESSELHKSKRQLLELLEQKDTEIKEKNATIQSYFDKIVTLTDNASSKDAALHESEAQLTRCHAACNRSNQEKELLEKHNSWLNDELTAKVNSLAELRRKHIDHEADMSVKHNELDRQVKEYSSALKRSKERAGELESRVAFLEEELRSSMATAVSNEERNAAELSTVTKLVELYKASTEEWSKKAGELEGVIKALETHLAQVENDYKEKLDSSISARQDLEKDAMELKEKLSKYETEIEASRKANELSLVPISNFHTDSNLEELSSGETGTDNMLVPKAPIGISATALATSLLRDGWSLAKMYEKYQDAADALRHEKWGRKHAEAMLERVLHEIEQKAELILDERAEHERLMESYTLLDQKLQQALAEHDNFQNTIRNLMAELKQSERDNNIAQKEIDDLQKQVTVLLKECQDIQVRCGAGSQIGDGNSNLNACVGDSSDCLDHLTFKDINGLIEQNVKLRSLVHNLSYEEEKRDAEMKEAFVAEVQKANNEATTKVEAMLKRSEEQGRMIESLHCSVAMYKRLYEEERKNHASSHSIGEILPGDGKELIRLYDNSQEVSKKSHEQLVERARNLEHDLDRSRSELSSLRSERDKFLLEANFSRERLDSFKKDYEILRDEANAVSARNVELSHLIIDYQKKLRENSDSYEASLESSRKLSMEVSFLKHEKDILVQEEKRASEEVRSLSERVHRLQSTLDTIQSAEEFRENARTAERRKDEDYLKRAEREWAEAKKELQEERDRVRSLTLDREKVIENSARQVEEIRKELADAWHCVASAESRAAVAEARFSDLEAKVNFTNKKVMRKDMDGDHSRFSTSEDTVSLKEEIEKLKEESQANKDYMLQYKSIAQTNEVALKQIESAHEEYKTEAENLKKSLEDEILSLRNQVSELESNYILKSEDASSAIEAKERALSSAFEEALTLREEIAVKTRQISAMEVQVSSLKDDLEKEHRRWRTTQDNYERQVILQSETIQELTNTSKEISSLQCELAKERKLSEALKTENDLLKISWEQEKSQLQDLKDEAERKYIEIDDQNKILHGRLESLHIRLAERERYSTGTSSQNSDSKLESDLQNVVSYLRRSKEIAETEVSLLKQEKSRLQSQLENALKASETAQDLLRSQRENSKAILFKDEEFKSLQLQVREICLLRESNIQLREENKHNFEESQKYREEARTAKWEAEKINALLKEKQLECDASQKEIEMWKQEIEQLKKRIAELLENSKTIDSEEHERMKNELQENKVLLSEKEEEIQRIRTQISSNQHQILELEQALTKCQLELTEQERRLNAALSVEVNIKQENEKQKKINIVLKKKVESLTREKEEISRENQALSKQIEDLKSSRRSTGDSPNDKEKEKDTRIQMLERTLQREREDKRKSKLMSQKKQDTLIDLSNTVTEAKKKLDDELTKHRQAVDAAVQGSMLTASELPSTTPLDDQISAYSQSLDKLQEAVNLVLNDGSGNNSSPLVISNVDASASVAGRQAPIQQIRSIAMVTDDAEKPSTAPKPVIEPRKGGRKLVRPNLVESAADIEMSAAEGLTGTEGGRKLVRPNLVESAADIELSAAEGLTTTEGKPSTSREPEHVGDTSVPQPTSLRKRRAPSPVLEVREDSVTQDEAIDIVVPVGKKSRDAEYGLDSSEGQTIPSTSENPDTVPQLGLSSDTADPEPAIEHLETEPASASTNDDVSDMANEDNTIIKEETDDQLNGEKDGTDHDDVQDEGDAMIEDIIDRPSAAVELLDESLKGEEGAEATQYPVEGDDEREEGELQDESEEKQDGTLEEGQLEPVADDEIGVTDETGDAAEDFSPDVRSERIENVDQLEEASEGSDKQNTISSNDQVATDVTQIGQASSSTLEGSPSTAVSQPPSSDTTIEKVEPRVGRTINLRGRSSQTRQLRTGSSSLSPRGRGRAVSTYRRDGSRGRGGRGARGSGFNDSEQP